MDGRVCVKVDNRSKLVRFDFDICDGSNLKDMQRVILGDVV